ncbi:MAG: hypothetical protein WCT49_03365 [Candidatus Paceibacterota bacterium]|jgi:hypothetical protein|nr:hypothetical protein [Candidatus Paceibacterota bacterium]
MNHIEGIPQQQEIEPSEKEAILKQVNRLLDGCSKEELSKQEKNVLDDRIAEMKREDLLNLTMDIQQYLNEQRNELASENTYHRIATVHGAACFRLEEMDSEK